jgi:hypothetical protein
MADESSRDQFKHLEGVTVPVNRGGSGDGTVPAQRRAGLEPPLRSQAEREADLMARVTEARQLFCRELAASTLAAASLRSEFAGHIRSGFRAGLDLGGEPETIRARLLAMVQAADYGYPAETEIMVKLASDTMDDVLRQRGQES